MDANSRYLPLAIVAGVLLFTSVTTTLLRCYVRKAIVKIFGWDDWLIVLSLFIYIGYSVIVFLGGPYGVGKHDYELSDSERMQAYKIWWIAYVAYGVSITVTRFSISLFFLRITVHRKHRYTIYFTIVWNVIAGICYLFVVIFQCVPIEFYWTKVIPGTQGRCIPIKAFVGLAYMYGAACVFCDLIFVGLPLVIVWKLDIGWRKKLSLAPILGMTGFAGCCPLVRMAYLHYLSSPDYIYDTVDIAIWSVLESGLAITACSLATLRPLFRIFHEHISSFGRSYALHSLPSCERDSHRQNQQQHLDSKQLVSLRGMMTDKEKAMEDSPSSEFVFFPEEDTLRVASSVVDLESGETRKIQVRTDIEIKVTDGKNERRGTGLAE